MRGYLFGVAILILSVIFIAGCDKKESTEKSRAVKSRVAADTTPKMPQNRFVIKDIDGRKTVVKLDEGIVSVKRVIQPIVIFYIFTPWCAPCRGVLPYLSMLQRKEKDNIFVIGLLVGESMDDAALREFMKRYDATFFISNSSDNEKITDKFVKDLSLPANYPLPMTIIYNRGRFVTEIGGAVPYEMLETVITQVKKEDR